MSHTLLEEQASKVASVNGIDVYRIRSNKFKTNTINIFFHDVLSKENVSKNALLPAVLRRGTEGLPTFQEIARYLEELYGSVFDCGITKKGERQIMQFYIEFVSDQYTDANLFEKAFGLLFDVITRPVLKDGTFVSEYVDQERENLKKMIESRVNDKVHYAVDKCFEAMCSDEPFGIYEYGSVSDLQSIDSKSLYEHYKKVLETLPIQVYVTGNVEDNKIAEMVKKISSIKRSNVKRVDISPTKKEVGEVKEVTEQMNVNQGKLSLGFRTNVPPNHENYYALLVYNTILGGGMHSKLFQNVREKASLAYYAFSRMEKFKGLMVISSGIEVQNKEKAKEIMLQQMQEIKAGNISDDEFMSSLKTIETGIKSLKDSQLQIVDFSLSQLITGTEDTFETMIDKVRKVSKKQVMAVSENIVLDTVYFLTSKEG